MKHVSNTNNLSEQACDILKNKVNNEMVNEEKPAVAQFLKSHKTLYENVTCAMEDYFSYLDGEPPTDLHQMVITQVECALLNFVMERMNQNRTKAAKCLGISRGTLLKKLAQHKVDLDK